MPQTGIFDQNLGITANNTVLWNGKKYGDVIDYLTPEMFGAKGDGITDDTAAIQAAIDATEAAGGGTVLFADKKTYLCNQPTLLSTGVDMIFGIKSSNISLIGNGNPTLKCTSPTPLVFLVALGAAKASGVWGDAWTAYEYVDAITYNISPAARGDDSITFTTPAEAGSFAPGDYVFIRTGEVLPSPNTHEPDSEINQVVSVNITTGVMKLRWPLTKSYQQEYFISGTSGYTSTIPTANPAPFGVAKITDRTIENISVMGLSFDVTCPTGVFAGGQAVNVRFMNNRVIGDGIITSFGNYRKGYFQNNIVHGRGINIPFGINPWWFSTATGSADIQILNNLCSANNYVYFQHIHEGSAQVDIINNIILNPVIPTSIYPAVDVAARAYGISILANTIVNAGQYVAINVQNDCLGGGIIANNKISGTYSYPAGIVDNLPTGWTAYGNERPDLTGWWRLAASRVDIISNLVNMSNLTIRAANAGLILDASGAGIPYINFTDAGAYKTGIYWDRASDKLFLDGGSLGITVGLDIGIGRNVDAAGVYKVSAVQVLGPRVVDARADDTINTLVWDSTTAGVLEALRTAAMTHGLIAPS